MRKDKKERNQFNVNLQYNSSWCLFSTCPSHAEAESSGSDVDEMQVDEGMGKSRADYEPYKFSSKNYTLDMTVHKKILRSLRKWAVSYLSENQCIQLNQYTEVDQMKGDKDIDLLCKVLKVYEKDEQTLELRIKDNTNTLWFLMLPKLKFGNVLTVRPGEIVRVRSVKRDLATRRNVLSHQSYTNIMKFLPCAKVIATMSKKIEDMTDIDKMLLEDDSEVIMQQISLTEIRETEKVPDIAAEKIFKLQDLFLNWEYIDA